MLLRREKISSEILWKLYERALLWEEKEMEVGVNGRAKIPLSSLDSMILCIL